jgi:hypothetical protein
MSSGRSENHAFLPASALAALVLGLVLCPFIYVAIGALGQFAPALSFVALPPLLISSGYLLFRFLGKPKEPASNSVWLIGRILSLIGEILSWFVIAAFLVIVSNFTLFTTFERISVLLKFFLLTSLFSLPFVLIRKTMLQQRLMQLPNSVIILLFILVVSISAAIVVVYLLSPTSVWR